MDEIEVSAVYLELIDHYTRARVTCSRSDHGDAIVMTMTRAVLEKLKTEIVRQATWPTSKPKLDKLSD